MGMGDSMICRNHLPEDNFHGGLKIGAEPTKIYGAHKYSNYIIDKKSTSKIDKIIAKNFNNRSALNKLKVKIG